MNGIGFVYHYGTCTKEATDDAPCLFPFSIIVVAHLVQL